MTAEDERSIHPLPDSDESRLHDEILVRHLRRIINVAVRVLAVLMTIVIVWGVIDVGYGIYEQVSTPPYYLLGINQILATFGAFIAVLIAIEIFINITVYLRDDVIHVKIVLATALMAIARKIIVLDTDKLEPEYLYGLAAVLFAMCIGYWLIIIKPNGTGQGPA
jgi:uncharacterized membrane protein (DUF373 family)